MKHASKSQWQSRFITDVRKQTQQESPSEMQVKARLSMPGRLRGERGEEERVKRKFRLPKTSALP
eukprot:11188469-Heterocapsa_arctica.AAC.1